MKLGKIVQNLSVATRQYFLQLITLAGYSRTKVTGEVRKYFWASLKILSNEIEEEILERIR